MNDFNPFNPPRVLIVGGGAVGVMAAYAVQSGNKGLVTVVCRSNYAAVKDSGFTIDSIDHGRLIRGFRPSGLLPRVPDLAANKTIDPYEYLIVTTKNIPDVGPPIHELIAPAVTPGKTTIILLQNGINIEKPLQAHFPSNHILSATSFIGATEIKPGEIRHDDRDRAKLGPFPSLSTQPFAIKTLATASAKRFLEMYNASGKVIWTFDEDVKATRWRKLVYNASFNSVSAILGMDTARMRMSQIVIDDLILPAMREIVAIARADGVKLPDGIEEEMVCVDPTDTAFVPSMGQDVAKGNYIEMENIVGEPVREAERLSVAAPTLKTLYGLLRGIQLTTKEKKGGWKPAFEAGNPYS